MKMPAAMASSPMIMPRPVKLKLNNAISPDKMSQMDSKSMPMFFVNLLMYVFPPFFIRFSDRYHAKGLQPSHDRFNTLA